MSNCAELIRGAAAQMAELHGKTVVIKVSGKVFASPHLKEVLEDVVNLAFSGIRIILVCGSQVQIDEKMKAAGMEIMKKDGIRVTPPEVIDLMKIVDVEIGVEILKVIEKMKHVPKILRPEAVTAEPISEEFKRTGSVCSVDTDSFSVADRTISAMPKIFIVSALAKAADGQFYNVNADEIAADIAVSLQAEKVIFLSDNGVQDRSKELTFFQLKASEAAKLMENNTAGGGMIPKLKAAIEAVDAGVKAAHIVSFHPGEFLAEILSNLGKGTVITKD